jgi:hypothetical protein
MREFVRAVLTAKPIICLLEPEAKHGGMDKGQIRAELLQNSVPCEKKGESYPNKYSMWGIAAEVESLGYHLPAGQKLFDALFADEAIEWIRIGGFQVCAGQSANLQ